MKSNILCPVCDYMLDEAPWNGDSPSDEICPQCGIHFGYNDSKPGDFRLGVYSGWRNKWKLDGKKMWRDNL